jgi:hypothetical protein
MFKVVNIKAIPIYILHQLKNIFKNILWKYQ